MIFASPSRPSRVVWHMQCHLLLMCKLATFSTTLRSAQDLTLSLFHLAGSVLQSQRQVQKGIPRRQPPHQRCLYLPRAFLCEQNENTNLLQGYTKKVIFGVTVIFGFFFVFRPIRFVLQIYTIFAKQKTRCKILYCPTLTTPNTN